MTQVPRRRDPASLTPAARGARFRTARGSKNVRLSTVAWTALAAIRERDGDASLTAAVERVILEARRKGAA